jgi:glycosyltransferase involved in cell wall biosynthesis
MKITFNTYPMAFSPPGGGEIQLNKYKQYLIKNGVDIELFDLWEPNLDRIELLHFFSCMGGSLPFIKHIQGHKLPILISPNLWIEKDKLHQYPHGEIADQLRCADKIICNSEMESQLLSDVFTLPIGTFRVIYNGVDERFFSVSEKSIFTNQFNIIRPYILSVANIEERKNQFTFLEALKNFPNFQLVSIGHIRDKNYYDKCKNFAGDQFNYIGPLNHDSIVLQSAFAGAIFFALPSLLETPGLAALEAAASGCKVLITEIGSTKEYFKNYAVYVNPFSKESIMNGIDQIINTPLDKNLSLHIKENFLWDNVINRLIDTYKEHS